MARSGYTVTASILDWTVFASAALPVCGLKQTDKDN